MNAFLNRTVTFEDACTAVRTLKIMQILAVAIAMAQFTVVLALV